MKTVASEEIVKRIAKLVDDPNIVSRLLKLKRSDLHSLFLEISDQAAKKQSIKGLIDAMRNDRFVKSSNVDQRELIAFDKLAYELLPIAYRALELSPGAPFGINSALSNVSQKNVISTTRSLEVLADTTTMLALICAIERAEKLSKNKKSSAEVSLATSHRLIRQQRFDDIEGFTPHFRVFSLATAGRDRGYEQFEINTFIEHVSFYLNLLTGLANSNQYSAHSIKVYISNMRITEKLIKLGALNRNEAIASIQHNLNACPLINKLTLLNEADSIKRVRLPDNVRHALEKHLNLLTIIEEKAVEVIRNKFPNVTFCFDLHRCAGIGYYNGLSFKIVAKNQQGKKFPLADGGTVDWTQVLVNSRKERCLVSGFGSELFCQQYTKKDEV